MYPCVSVCISIRVRVCVTCGFFLSLLHVHSLYDTTMTRLSRLEKGGGALARRRRPSIAIVCLLEEGFYSLSLSPFLRFCFSAVEGSDRAILV